MKILLTGAKGLIGKKLSFFLKEKGYEVLSYDVGDEDKLEEYVSSSDFIINLAGINRPLSKEEFYEKFFNGEIREGQNTDCEYFPCHEKQENCTFCYCPIYPCGDGATNGKWITDKDVWNCKDCNWIHNDKAVDEILDFVKENIHSM